MKIKTKINLIFKSQIKLKTKVKKLIKLKIQTNQSKKNRGLDGLKVLVKVLLKIVYRKNLHQIKINLKIHKK